MTTPTELRIQGGSRVVLLVVGSILFASFFMSASVDFNNKIPLDDWKSDLRADAGGYYVYLPGLFHHGMRATSVNDSLVSNAGQGFALDREHDRIVTKYTYGTALLQLPFFLSAEVIAGVGTTDGWTRTHHRAIEMAGIFYWTLGLLFLGLALMKWRPVPPWLALLVLCCVAFGTNTFYYAFRSAGYSHIYSFFLIAVALYAVFSDRNGAMTGMMRRIFVVASALIIVVRPIDALAVIALYALFFIRSPASFRNARIYVDQLFFGLLVLFPQLLYWKFVHGSWVVYSYGDEGFTHWADPKWAEVLFAPMNGIVPYAPVFLLLPFGAISLWHHERRLAVLLVLLFTAVLYSCAAWHAWHFGCSYGMRPLVQYTPFLAIGLWALFDHLRVGRPAILHGTVPLVLLVCFVSYRAQLQYGCCYLWGEWEWMPYGRNLVEAFFGKVQF